VGATFGQALLSKSLLYDPTTGELVGLEFIDDVNFSCYGDISRDCASRWPENSFYAGCDGLDAGVPATFGDAAPFVCEVVEVADGGVIADAGL
jgi:hypothetical protein